MHVLRWAVLFLSIAPSAALRQETEQVPPNGGKVEMTDLLGLTGSNFETSAPCGFHVDCPLSYSLADVNKSAASAHTTSMHTNTKALHEAHNSAREQCEKASSQDKVILKDGGWCYEVDTAQHPPPVPANDMDFLIPKHHVSADDVYVKTLSENVLKKPDGSCCYSLSDFGAGVGQFGHALKALLPNLEYYGYDGAGNVEEFTNNYVKWADLSMPLSVKRTDWVLSSEVGEHIPNRHEEQFIANIHAHNCKGVILSWAVLNQGGYGHVNNHANEFIIKIFEGLGYRYNKQIADALRVGRKDHAWLTGSSMAFERISTPSGCVG